MFCVRCLYMLRRYDKDISIHNMNIKKAAIQKMNTKILHLSRLLHIEYKTN